MKTPEKIALFDLDNTLADYAGQMYKSLDSIRAPDEPVFRFDAGKAPEHIERRMSLIKLIPGWWEKLPMLDDGFKIMEAAVKIGFQPHVLTKGPFKTTQAWAEKVVWCQRHIDTQPFMKEAVGITVTHDKGLTYGTILVDDWVPYVKRWLEWRPRGLVIMPARKCNEGFTHDQVVRFNGENWNEVVKAMETAYNRY